MNENTITISTEEYKELIAAKVAADQFKKLLENEMKKQYPDSELKTVCLMFGIPNKKEDEEQC